jgi:hypothetical protein
MTLEKLRLALEEILENFPQYSHLPVITETREEWSKYHLLPGIAHRNGPSGEFIVWRQP